MGTPWTTYYPSGVPQIGDADFLSFARGLRDQRLTNAGAKRTNHRYVELDPVNGTPTGGGGDGSIGNPWLVADGDEFATLFAAQEATDTHWHVQAAIFRSLTGWVITVGGVTIEPIEEEGYVDFTSFFNDVDIGSHTGTSEWHNEFGSGPRPRWARDLEDTAVCPAVRLAGSYDSLDDGTEQVMLLAAAEASNPLTAIEDQAGSYAIASDVIHIQTFAGGNPYGLIEISRGENAIGLLIDQVDDVVIRRFRFTGWGAQRSDDTACAVVVDISGDQEVLFEDCSFYWSGRGHVMALRNTNTGVPGGILTLHNCRAGLTISDHNPGTMGPTVDQTASTALLRCISAEGGQEVIISECTGKYGCVPEFYNAGDGHTVSPRRGRLALVGTGTAEKVGLFLSLDNVVEAHEYGARSGSGCNDAEPYTTSHLHTDEYRAFILNEDIEAADDTTFDTRFDFNYEYLAYVNCKIRSRPSSSVAHTTAHLFRDNFTSRKCVFLNCLIHLDLGEMADSGANYHRAYTRAPFNDLIFIDTSGTPTSVQFGGNTHDWLTDDFVRLYGTSGITPDVNGVQKITRISSSEFTFDVESSGSFLSTATLQSAEPLTFIHCHFHVSGTSGCLFAWDSLASHASHVLGKRWFNCILSILTNDEDVAQNFALNGAPATTQADIATGGMSHCAFYGNIQAANSGTPGSDEQLGFDSTTNPVTLGAAPTPLADPSSTDLFEAGTTTLPFPVEYDINEDVMPATPSIGPVQGVSLPAPLHGSTGLAITLDGEALTDQATYEMAHQSVASGNVSQELKLWNVGEDVITINSLTIPSWRVNLELSGFSLPITLNPGESVAGAIATTTYPAQAGPLAGGYYGRVSVNYTETTAKSAYVQFWCVLWDPLGDPEDLPTKEEFWESVEDYYIIATGGGPTSPGTFGWGLETPTENAWVSFFENVVDVDAAAAAGMKRIRLKLPFGDWFDADGILVPNAYRKWIDWCAANSRTDLSSSWIAGLQRAASAGITVVCYVGGFKNAQDCLDTIVGPSATVESFLAYFFDDCYGWAMAQDNVELCYDDLNNTTDEEDNPLMDPANNEPRAVAVELVKDIKARRSLKSSREPRTLDSITWQRGSNGWGFAALQGTDERNNPDYYPDAAGATTDAHIAPEPMTQMSVDGGKGLLPIKIAAALYKGRRSAVPITSGWNTGGDDFDSLYNAVTTIIALIQGSAEV